MPINYKSLDKYERYKQLYKLLDLNIKAFNSNLISKDKHIANENLIIDELMKYRQQIKNDSLTYNTNLNDVII